MNLNQDFKIDYFGFQFSAYCQISIIYFQIWLNQFYSISTFVGYLTPNSLISSISNNSV